MLLRVRWVSVVSTPWLVAAGLAAGGAALVLRRVEVEGDSMVPSLLAGDRLLAVRVTSAPPGALVVVADPRLPVRKLVKRVAAADEQGLFVQGDNPRASTDSRAFGPVSSVWARVVYRYHPRSRAGPLLRAAAVPLPSPGSRHRP